MAKAWKWFWMLGFAALIPSVAAPQDVVGKLQKSFLQPPPSARPHTWWHWVNDNVTKEGITADLEALAKAGVGGVQIFHVDVGVPQVLSSITAPNGLLCSDMLSKKRQDLAWKFASTTALVGQAAAVLGSSPSTPCKWS